MNRYFYLIFGCLFLFLFITNITKLINNFSITNLIIELIFIITAVSGIYLFAKVKNKGDSNNE